MTSRRGFTLVEILVATAILAMVGVILFSAMTLSTRGRRVSQRQLERYQTARVAVTRMVRELESAYLTNHRNEERFPKTIFLGSNNRIDFTYLGHLRIAAGAKECDQGAVSYYLESDRDLPGTTALMRRSKTPVDDRPERGGVVQKLAENVKSLRFEYWDPKQEDWEREWNAEPPEELVSDPTGLTPSAVSRVEQAMEVLEGSDDEYILPTRVRIQLVLKDEDGREYAFESQVRIYLREPLNW